MDPVSELQRLQGNLIRVGVVAEVDPAAACCRVDSGGVRTACIPWLAPRAGDSIDWSAPSVGEQVLLLSPGGDLHGAVVLRGLYSTQRPPPSADPDVHLTRHADGAVIQYDAAAHALTATLPAGGSATLTADAGVTVNGPLTVNGDTQVNGDLGISGAAEAQTDVIGAGISLKGHKHLGVTAGGATSGPPEP